MSSIADLLGSNGEFGADKTFTNTGCFVQGKVIDNGSKKEPGMVKVEYIAWKDTKNICEWIPMLHSYAGKRYGSYVMPEIGDIVLVGFIGSGMTRPFVLGVLFPADAKMPRKEFTEKNYSKAFITKGGIKIHLNDKKTKQSVEVETPKGLSLTLDDDKDVITLKDKKGSNILDIDTKSGKVTIEAKTKIKFKTGKCSISMDGATGAIKLKGAKISLKANQKVSAKGTQQVAISGGMVKVNGTQTTKVSGGGMTQIKGGMVKIN